MKSCKKFYILTSFLLAFAIPSLASSQCTGYLGYYYNSDFGSLNFYVLKEFSIKLTRNNNEHSVYSTQIHLDIPSNEKLEIEINLYYNLESNSIEIAYYTVQSTQIDEETVEQAEDHQSKTIYEANVNNEDNQYSTSYARLRNKYDEKFNLRIRTFCRKILNY